MPSTELLALCVGVGRVGAARGAAAPPRISRVYLVITYTIRV